jgi:hypothetical protein
MMNPFENPVHDGSRRVENWRGDVQVDPWLVSPFPVPCPFRIGHHPFSSSRHFERSVRISRTTLSCCFHVKVYVTYQVGSAFGAW